MSASSHCFCRDLIQITLIVLTQQNGTWYTRSCIDGYAHRTCLAQVFFLAAILSEAMAASSGDDIKTQLANILGRPLARIGQIRKTDETPPRISVIDVVIVITGKNASNAARDVGFLKERYPDVIQKLSHVKLVDSLGRRGEEIGDRIFRSLDVLLCRYL